MSRPCHRAGGAPLLVPQSLICQMERARVTPGKHTGAADVGPVNTHNPVIPTWGPPGRLSLVGGIWGLLFRCFGARCLL